MKKLVYKFYKRFKSRDFTIRLRTVSVARVLLFKELLDQTRKSSGDIVECGVGASKTFQMLAILLQLFEPERTLWGFDSFEGFPEPSKHDKSFRAQNLHKGKWFLMTVDQVFQTLRTIGIRPEVLERQVILVKGFLAETLPKAEVEKIVLLHLDVDMYDSYKVCLEQFYPKVVPGGAIVFDEYEDDVKNWPGAKKAIDEFFGEQKSLIQKDLATGKYYFIKPH